MSSIYLAKEKNLLTCHKILVILFGLISYHWTFIIYNWKTLNLNEKLVGCFVLVPTNDDLFASLPRYWSSLEIYLIEVKMK